MSVPRNTSAVSSIDLSKRDLTLDLARVFAVLLVVVIHLLETGVGSGPGGLVVSRPLEHQPWFNGVTWVFQIMPLFFVVGGFASMTAHVSALYPSFLGAALATGAPPMAAVLSLAFFSNLNAGITHYGTGSAPVYFSPGFVSQSTWWTLGLVVSVVNLATWLGVGFVWWQLIGLW